MTANGEDRPTLVLPPRHSVDTGAVRRAAERARWRVERLSSWRVPEWLKGRDTVLYGEPLFAEVVAPQLEVALIGPSAAWLPELPERYRRRDVRLITLAQAEALDVPLFVKPPTEKSFPAKVYASGKQLRRAASDQTALAPDTPVLAAEPVEWEVEYRCFVLDRHVVAMSPYLRRGELAVDADGAWCSDDADDAEAETFAATLLADPAAPFPPAVVLDVGRIAGRGWAAVELNPAFGSGIYGCSPDDVLRAVRRASVPRDRVGADDAPWVMEQQTEVTYDDRPE